MHLAYIFTGNRYSLDVMEIAYSGDYGNAGDFLLNGPYEQEVVYDEEDAIRCSICGKLIGYENKGRYDLSWDANGKRYEHRILDYGVVDRETFVCSDCQPTGLRIRYVSPYSRGIGHLIINGKYISVSDFVEYEEECYDHGVVTKRLSHRKVRENLPPEMRSVSCEQLDDIQDYIEKHL